MSLMLLCPKQQAVGLSGKAQFFADVTSVFFHGFGRYEEHVCNLGCGVVFGEEAQDFPFRGG